MSRYRNLKLQWDPKNFIKNMLFCIIIVLAAISVIYTIDGITRLVKRGLQLKDKKSNPLEFVASTSDINSKLNSCIINDKEKNEQYIVVYSYDADGNIAGISVQLRH